MIKESKPEYPLKVSQATLAEMVGTTRARVSEFMSGFKKKGFVSYNGSLQINSALVIAFLQSRHPCPLPQKGRLKMTKKPTLKQVQAVRCPTCGARPGEKCELSTGQLRTDPHRDRRLEAADAAART
jgi:hypothetical protein